MVSHGTREMFRMMGCSAASADAPTVRARAYSPIFTLGKGFFMLAILFFI